MVPNLKKLTILFNIKSMENILYIKILHKAKDTGFMYFTPIELGDDIVNKTILVQSSLDKNRYFFAKVIKSNKKEIIFKDLEDNGKVMSTKDLPQFWNLYSFYLFTDSVS